MTMANETPHDNPETLQTILDARQGEPTTPATGVALASVPPSRRASRRRALLKVAGVSVAAAVVAGAVEVVQHGAGVHGSGTGGITHVVFLPNPIRLLDTRNSSPYQAGSDHTVQITGVIVNGTSVPTGAAGVFGNVTVVSPTSGGDLRLYPAGASLPNTSNINFASGQIIANGVTVALNTNGQLAIHVDMLTGTHTNVLFDVSAYVFYT